MDVAFFLFIFFKGQSVDTLFHIQDEVKICCYLSIVCAYIKTT